MNEPKLNLFALPSQTTILFGLIVTVLLGALFVGSIGSSPIVIWPLTLALLFLPLRAFLSRPEREIARYHLVMAGNDFAGLQEKIKALAEKIDLQRMPKLAIGPIKAFIYTFGTPKHWFIVIKEQEAQKLQKDLSDENNRPAAEAKLIHELYHFKTGDYWKLGYARELLRLVVVFMLWVITFFTGLGLFLFVALPGVVQLNFNKLYGQLNLPPEMRRLLVQMLPSPAMMEQLRQKVSEINLFLVLHFVLASALPFILVGGLIWWLYLPTLWRTREIYADAGVVHTQGEALPFLAAVTGIPLFRLKKYHHILSATLERTKTFGRSLKELTKNHPPTEARIAQIKKPSAAFANWYATAMLAGSFALILDILLSSSLTLIYVGKWPMHFSTLSIFVLVSLSFIPALVQGQSVNSDLFKIISVVVGLRLVWLLFTLGLLFLLLYFAPDTLSKMLEAAISSVAHYAGHSDEAAIDNLRDFVFKASIVNLVQVAIIFVLLLAALAGVTFLLRRLLTWYGFPEARQRLMKVAYWIIGLAALFFAMTVLPLVTIALISPADLLNPTSFIMPILGLIITTAGLGWFFRADQKYAHRCPNCDASVDGPFHLGKRCEACDRAIFHPWLIAEYQL